jgi:hypothetical protein
VPRFLGGFRVHPQQKTAVCHESWGVPEMKRIITREHGRPLRTLERGRHIFGYLLKHALWQRLYSWGLLRY